MEESFKTAQENAVTDALLDKTEVTKYPEDKLKDEIEFNENYYKEYAKSMGITYKEMIQQMGYDDEDTYKKELEDYAKENVKYYLMCDTIAEEEGITVSDSCLLYTSIPFKFLTRGGTDKRYYDCQNKEFSILYNTKQSILHRRQWFVYYQRSVQNLYKYD